MDVFKGRYFDITKDLDIAEVAKLLRKEIKITHPTVKCSVRIDRYAGGQAIRVWIKSFGFPALGADGKFKPEVYNLIDQIEKLREQYNYSEVDCLSDYNQARYYGTTGIDHAAVENERLRPWVSKDERSFYD